MSKRTASAYAPEDYSALLNSMTKQTPSFSQSATKLKKAMTCEYSCVYQRGDELVVRVKEGESTLKIDAAFDWAYLKAAGAKYLTLEQKGGAALIPTDRTGALTEADGGWKLDVGNESVVLRIELSGKPASARLQRLENGVWIDCNVECTLADVSERRVLQTPPVPSGTYRAVFD